MIQLLLEAGEASVDQKAASSMIIPAPLRFAKERLPTLARFQFHNVNPFLELTIELAIRPATKSADAECVLV